MSVLKPNYMEVALSTMSEGYTIQDQSGAVIAWNQAALDILQVSAEMLTTRNPSDLSYSCIREDGSRFSSYDHPCAALLRTGVAQRLVVLGIKHNDGRLIWTQMNTLPFDGMIDGSPRGVLTTFSDFTVQFKKKFALDRRDRELLEIQSIARIGCFSHNQVTGERVWTPEMYKIFGFDDRTTEPSLEEMYAKIHPDDHQICHIAIHRMLAGSEPITFRYRLVHEDRIKWIESVARAVRSEESLELHGTVQDITDKVSSETENNLIFGTLNFGLWKYDIHKNTLDWDHRTYEIFGTSEAEFSGTIDGWLNCLHPEDKGMAVKEFGDALAGTKPLDMFFRIITASGDVRHLGGKGVVEFDQHKRAVSVKGINWDRTKEVLLQESMLEERAKSIQSSKLASLGEMAGGVAHEINNPLTMIHSTVGSIRKMMDKGKLTDEALTESLNDIDDTVKRISQIISGLRNLSRDSSAEAPTQFTMRDVVTDVLSICEERFRIDDVDFRLNILDSALDVSIETRRIQLSQVLLNLFMNSYDAIRGRSPKWISFEVAFIGRRIRLTVKDCGTGISQVLQEKIFNPFFTTKEIGKGTGLGLSLSKTLIEKNQGQLYLDASCEHTSFVIELPKILG